MSQRVAEPAHDVRVEEERGRIVLRRRRFGPVRSALARAAGAKPDFVITLDALGSAAWRLLDGRRTVGEVRVALVAQFPGEADVGARLGKFVGTLVSHHMIRLR